jgi:hypothetical protein
MVGVRPAQLVEQALAPVVEVDLVGRIEQHRNHLLDAVIGGCLTTLDSVAQTMKDELQVVGDGPAHPLDDALPYRCGEIDSVGLG